MNKIMVISYLIEWNHVHLIFVLAVGLFVGSLHAQK